MDNAIYNSSITSSCANEVYYEFIDKRGNMGAQFVVEITLSEDEVKEILRLHGAPEDTDVGNIYKLIRAIVSAGSCGLLHEYKCTVPSGSK